MNKHKVKISIAGREYPMRITADEEEIVRKAAKIIKESINQFDEKYDLRDNQDALAMCALQYVSKSLYHEQREEYNSGEVEKKIDKLVQEIRDISSS